MSERTILSLKAEIIELPLYNPFVIAVRTATSSKVVRWLLQTNDGKMHFGESVPVFYVTGETPDSVIEIAPQLAARVQGKLVSEFGKIIKDLEARFPNAHSARAGVEIALYNALADYTEIPHYKLHGGLTNFVLTDLTIAKLPNAVEIAKEAWSEGFRIFKMKVGGEDIDGDLQRVLDVQQALPEATFRLDGNQGFDIKGAISFIDHLIREGVKLELVEQPVPKDDLVSLAQVSANSQVPVIADEACKSPQDAYRLFSTTPVHGVNVKLMKSGISGALGIIEVAKAADRQLMIGCMLESPVGIAAALAVACGTGAFHYIDLDGHLLLNLPDPITEFRFEGPKLMV